MEQNQKSMFEHPSLKPLRLSGLDLGPDAIKIVELTEQYHIKHSAMVSIEKSDIYSAIEKAIHISEISTPYVAIAMPETEVFSQIMTIDSNTKPEEMEEIILVQIEPFVSWPLDEIQLDVETLHATSLQVRVTASHRKQIEQRINLLKKAHLVPLIIDFERDVLERAHAHPLADLAPELTLSYGLALRRFIP